MKLAEEHKEERERVMEEMTLRRAEEVQRLRQELQEEGEARVSALREALERGMAEERSALEKGIEEARAALRSLQASLDNDLSKYMKRFHVVQPPLLYCHFCMVFALRLTCLSPRPPGGGSETETRGPVRS